MSNRVTPDKSLVETIISGFDKPGAVVRASIGRVLLDDATAPKPDKILSGATYDLDRLKKALKAKTGIQLQAGQFDKDNPWYQDATNFVADAALYTVLDPLTYIGGAIPKLGKALLGIELAGAATGGVIGALSGDTAAESVRNAAVGAAATGIGAPVLKATGSAIGKVGADFLNTQMAGAFPHVFEGTAMKYTDAFDVVNKDKKLFEHIGRNMRELDTKLGLYDLGAEDSAILDSYMKSKSSQWTGHRNNLITVDIAKANGIKPIGAAAIPNAQHFVTNASGKDIGRRYSMLGDEMLEYHNGAISKVEPKDMRKLLKRKDLRKVDKLDDISVIEHMTTDATGGRLQGHSVDELNNFSAQTNSFIGNIVKEELATAGNPALTRNVAKFVDRNRQAIKTYNEVNAGRKGFDSIVPIDFHTFRAFVPDEKMLKKGADQYKGLKSGFMKLTNEQADEVPLTLQERLKRESEHFYKNFLSKKSKEAAKIVSGVRYSRTADDAGYISKFVNKVDEFTGFLKQQQLTFSHSWIVNNFTENLVKAYMAGGSGNMLEVLGNQGKALFRNSDGMMKDLLKLTDPNSAKAVGLAYDNNAVKTALDYGVVGEDFFSEAFKPHMSEAYLSTRVGKDEAKKIIERGQIGGLAKLKDNYSEFLANTVGRTGSLIEQSARITTFKNVADDLLDNADAIGLSVTPEYKALVRKAGILEAPRTPELDVVLKKAAQITNETFFDYGNVSAFEQEVMKRMFPYWTFFSRNIPYWLDAVGNNPKRISNVLNVYKSLGDAPTDTERNKIPDYLLDRGARVTEGGAIATAPALSMIDAVNATDWRRSSLDKFHPLINTAINLATKTTNLGGNLYPSEAKSGKVKVMGSGELMSLLAPYATFRDTHGDKQTSSDLFSVISMLKGNILPTPALDTAAKIIESTGKGNGLGLELLNLGPTKTKIIAPDEASRTIDFRSADLARRLRNERSNQ